MSVENALKPLFVVIYPYRYSDFLYGFMEIEYFKLYCEVQVWDLSLIVDPKYAKAVSSVRPSKKEVILVESIRQFFKLLMNIRKTAKQRKICIFNEVTLENISSVFFNLMIKSLIKVRGVAILDAYNGGIQIFEVKSVNSQQRNNWITKLIVLMNDTNSLSEAVKLFKNFVSILIVRIFNIYPTTHRLVAGDDWIKVAKLHGAEKKGIKLIYGSSNDFSNYLLNRSKKSNTTIKEKRTAVLLDGAGPAYAGDHIHLRRKPVLTSDVWYPALTRFFDRIESESGVVIEVAAHYKSNHPPVAPCFGNRRVYYEMARELVRDSEFVITRMSAAVSYAVIYRKPIVYIYSDQLKNDQMAMANIERMAAALGKIPVNIDDPNISILDQLTVDEEKYAVYEKACLTSVKPLRPNVQIILEEVMGLKVDPDLFGGRAYNGG